MIQRKQTLWLLLAGILLFMTALFPLLSKEFGGILSTLYSTAVKSNIPQGNTTMAASMATNPLFILNIFVATLCMVNIFHYKNRQRQKALVLLGVFMIMAFIGAIFYYAFAIFNGFEGLKFHPGIIMPFVALILNLMAISGINHDERLIKSADRLR